MNVSMFTDDCVLYTSGNNWPSIKDKFQDDLDIFIWLNDYKLSL